MAVSAPDLSGYLTFIRTNSIPISAAALPDDSSWIQWTFDFAIQWVNEALQAWPANRTGATSMYSLAVYNLGVDRLVNWAPDAPDDLTFSLLREQYRLDSFTAGVVNASNDVSTGQSLLVPDCFKNFNIFDLQTLKTPWGRMYMSIAQQYGPTIWGLS